MKKPLIIANWKMNSFKQDVQRACETWSKLHISCELVFCPPICYLASCHSLVLGGQACHPQAKGAYTGSVSASMLADLGCQYVLVGHSETRPCDVFSIVHQVQESSMLPVMCVGHRHMIPDVFDIGQERDYVLEMIERECRNLENFVLAYEPISAIGTGQALNQDQIQYMVQAIREVVPQGTPVLYGGSVTAQNGCAILEVTDGVLIGGMSLNIESFADWLNKIHTKV